MKNKVYVFCIVFCFLISFCSAEVIFYNDFEEIYGIGDIISVNFSLDSTFAISDFIETFLQCGEETFIVSKEYIKLSPDVKKYFNFDFPAPISGDCFLRVIFNDYESNGGGFEISNEILIDYSLNDRFFSPGEDIIISGSAIKKGGGIFEGNVFVSINELVDKNIGVVDEKFSLVFSVPTNAFPREYELIIEAEEKDWKGNVINFGKKIDNLEILSRPSKIFVESNEIFKPATNFSFKVSLLDQADRIVLNESVLVKIFDIENNLILETNVLSGEEVFYFFEDSSPKGRWSFNAYYGNVFTSFHFYVEENKKLGFDFLDGKLLIENIGNVFYEGVVVIDIGNSSSDDEIFVSVSLPIGDTLEYSFDKKGYYDINVGENSFENVYLTGASIFMTPYFNFRSYVISFIIFCLVVIYFLYRGNYFNKKKNNCKSYNYRKGHNSKKIFNEERSNSSDLRKKAHICIVFLKFDPNFDFSKSIKKYGLVFKELQKGLGYILFYSPNEKNAGLKMFNFAREVKNLAWQNNHKVSIMLNSVPFVNKDGFIKEFALFNRKLLNFVSNKIIVPKKVLDNININTNKKIEKLSALNKKIEVYFF